MGRDGERAVASTNNRLKTRDRIKIAAQRLFAERGIEAVTVREIVVAAGQKNMASLHYYFRTKEDLARELLLDAATLIEARRTELLDRMEALGGPHQPREVLKILIECAVMPPDDPGAFSTVRLFTTTYQKTPEFLLDAVGEGKANVAYDRCLDHLRHFMRGTDPGRMERRLYLLQQYVFGALSAREFALSQGKGEGRVWAGPGMLDELVSTAEGILFAGLPHQNAAD
ncbi:hypothetical protein GCM10007924_30130 [Sneathiella chinensis]|uniref:HTH tetR-type domain-containing protein n=1 Tax=Sneathiella chinensis TaxID=349750 RepID=A0ABQ5U8R0_9PROT|nr:hypothetical protein GCM10007924_30130 [Sneathiella chinensis]